MLVFLFDELHRFDIFSREIGRLASLLFFLLLTTLNIDVLGVASMSPPHRCMEPSLSVLLVLDDQIEMFDEFFILEPLSFCAHF